jgi:hypothetical protein
MSEVGMQEWHEKDAAQTSYRAGLNAISVEGVIENYQVNEFYKPNEEDKSSEDYGLVP